MKDLLEHSREYFVRYGGAVGDLLIGNKVCAVGAVRMADIEEICGHSVVPLILISVEFDSSKYSSKARMVLAALDAKADEVYHGSFAWHVNDHLGPEAVLHVFDLCIKDCEDVDGD